MYKPNYVVLLIKQFLSQIIPGMESEVAEGEKILNNFMTRTCEERQSIEVP